RLELRNIDERPSAWLVRLQRLIRDQQEVGLRVISPKRVRPPQIPASGYVAAKAISRSMAPSSTSVSGLRRRRNSPVASCAATLLAAAKPRFSSRQCTIARSPYSRCNASAEPSDELLSMTISSNGVSRVSAQAVSKHFSVISRVL